MNENYLADEPKLCDVITCQVPTINCLPWSSRQQNELGIAAPGDNSLREELVRLGDESCCGTKRGVPIRLKPTGM